MREKITRIEIDFQADDLDFDGYCLSETFSPVGVYVTRESSYLATYNHCTPSTIWRIASYKRIAQSTIGIEWNDNGYTLTVNP